MQAIWKFPLSIQSAAQQVDMPRGAKILLVHEQHGRPTIWAEVNENSALETRTFFIVATGERFSGFHPYIGTAFCGDFVWHVLEVNL